MRRGIGALLAIGGVALVWLLRRKHEEPIVVERHLRLVSKNGRCEIQGDVEPVTLRRSARDEVHWIVTNPAGEAGCGRPVNVSVLNWKYLGKPPIPPVNAAPVSRPGGGPLSETVAPGEAKPIPARARLLIPRGHYKYDVAVEGGFILDPMVEVVP